MALNFKRKKTSAGKAEKWDIHLNGYRVGEMRAVHSTAFQRTMEGSVRVPLANGSSKSATVKGERSFRKLLNAFNRELGLNASQVRPAAPAATVTATAAKRKAPAKKKKTAAKKRTALRKQAAKPAAAPAAAPAAPAAGGGN